MNNKYDKQIEEIKTRHGQVADQQMNPQEEETTMTNFNTIPIFNQMNAEVPELLEEARLPDRLGEGACPWLDEYVKFSRKWSPLSYDGYHEACGLFVLSTVAARRVIFNYGRERATNLYILLVGRTSIHAKSTAAEIAVGLLRVAGLDWLLAPDEITPQKLIQIMSSGSLPENFSNLNDHEQQKTINRVLTAGQKGWFLDEFGGNLSSMVQPTSVMSGLKDLIRKLDGTPPEYDYSTIIRGQNLIRKPYLSLLGNVTIADLVPHARKGAALWRDGFFPRFAMVVPPANQLEHGNFPNTERIFPETLKDNLVDWSERLGLPEYQIVGSDSRQFLQPQSSDSTLLKISDDVFDACNNYHMALRDVISRNEIEDFDGNYARFHEKALRIAALFASINNFKSIKLNHWAKAQEITERWRIGLHELHRQVNDINQDQPTAYIKDRPYEEQILRAVRIKGIANQREIAQFTTLKMEVVTPTIARLLQENRLIAINDNGKECYKLPS